MIRNWNGSWNINLQSAWNKYISDAKFPDFFRTYQINEIPLNIIQRLKKFQ